MGRAESKFGKCAYHTLPKYGLIVERVFRELFVMSPRCPFKEVFEAKNVFIA